jgi:glucose-1-phosphate adenylyltransferase
MSLGRNAAGAWQNACVSMKDVLSIILGGGRGTRLFPLTLHRSKPAVPIAGKYRLIDIPVSNCLNSDLRRIFVLTQYNSESLNKHVAQTYKFDHFTAGFVSILAAEQTEDSPDWFQGTADAVRQSVRHLEAAGPYRDVCILSGDQLYNMDLKRMVEAHRRNVADITVAVTPIAPEQASAFGILKTNLQGRIVHFDEKPPAERVPGLMSETPGGGTGLLASMGIYVFSRQALLQAVANPALVDFGRHVIPAAVPSSRVHAYVHRGYWEDVGTIQSYFHANLALTQPLPPFDFYEASSPIYTQPNFLPATKVESCTVRNTLLSEGCIVVGSELERCVVGIRSRIGAGCRLRDTLVLGADAYETLDDINRGHAEGRPAIGIGADSVVANAIVDKNARIGRGVRIENAEGVQEKDGSGYFIRDGIVIVPKNGTIPDGAVI